jgi:hypothetical protein
MGWSESLLVPDLLVRMLTLLGRVIHGVLNVLLAP